MEAFLCPTSADSLSLYLFISFSLFLFFSYFIWNHILFQDIFRLLINHSSVDNQGHLINHLQADWKLESRKALRKVFPVYLLSLVSCLTAIVSLISNVSQKTLDIGNHFFQSFIYNLQRACRSNISLRQAFLSNMLF